MRGGPRRPRASGGRRPQSHPRLPGGGGGVRSGQARVRSAPSAAYQLGRGRWVRSSLRSLPEAEHTAQPRGPGRGLPGAPKDYLRFLPRKDARGPAGQGRAGREESAGLARRRGAGRPGQRDPEAPRRETTRWCGALRAWATARGRPLARPSPNEVRGSAYSRGLGAGGVRRRSAAF